MTYSRPERVGKKHRFDRFSCGEEPLDDWARTQAKSANGSDSAAVFVVTLADSAHVVAFYALASASVERVDVPGRVGKYMPSSVPCILLARLAVDQAHQGKGLGKALLKDALQRSVSAAETIGARALLVHAKHEKARDFYCQYDFEPSPSDPPHLWLLMKDIRESLPPGTQS